MNTPRRILQNTAALTVVSAGQLAGNIILFFYLSRLLQPEGLGIYSTVLAVFSTVNLGCGIGLNVFLPRELPKDLSQTNRYLIHASLVSVASAIALLIGLVLLTPHLGYLPLTQTGLYIISLALIPDSVGVVLAAIFISHQRAMYLTVTSVFVILGRILVSLLALRLGFGVLGVIVVYAAFSYLSVLINLYFLKRHIVTPHWEFEWPFLWKMLRELKVFAALALLNALFSQSEVIILSLTRGETQVGYYSAALKLVTIWIMLPTSYVTAMFPVLSATYQESRPRAISLQNRSLKYLLAIAFPLAAGLFVTADAIILLFYGPEYQESIGVLRILAWYLPLVFCNMVLWRVLIVRGEQRVVFRVQFINEMIQALLAVALTPRFGCYGAAWALLGGNLTYLMFCVYYVRRDKTNLPLLGLSWRFLLASAVMGLFGWIFASRVQLWILIPLSAAIYAALVVVLRAFAPEDWTLLRKLLKPDRAGRQVRNEVTLTDQSTF